MKKHLSLYGVKFILLPCQQNIYDELMKRPNTKYQFVRTPGMTTIRKLWYPTI